MSEFPKNPPAIWEEYPLTLPQGRGTARAWIHRLMIIKVLRSISTVDDGSKWIHVSVSRPDSIPAYEILAKVKREFIGEEHEAYQVFPAKKDHVNLYPYCLHLWSPMDKKRRVANLRDLTNEEAF